MATDRFESQETQDDIDAINSESLVSITTVSGVVSVIEDRIHERNGIVVGSILIALVNTPPSSWLTIGTVAARPKEVIWGIAADGGTVEYAGVYSIQTDGTLRIYIKNGTKSVVLTSVCYIKQ